MNVIIVTGSLILPITSRLTPIPIRHSGNTDLLGHNTCLNNMRQVGDLSTDMLAYLYQYWNLVWVVFTSRFFMLFQFLLQLFWSLRVSSNHLFQLLLAFSRLSFSAITPVQGINVSKQSSDEHVVKRDKRSSAK